MLGNGQIVPYREKLDTYSACRTIVFWLDEWYNQITKRKESHVVTQRKGRRGWLPRRPFCVRAWAWLGRATNGRSERLFTAQIPIHSFADIIGNDICQYARRYSPKKRIHE